MGESSITTEVNRSGLFVAAFEEEEQEEEGNT